MGRGAARARLVRAALCLLAVSGCGGCKNDDKPAADKPDAAAAGPRAADLVIPLPGCHATIAGGSALAGIAPGALSVAAANGKALVVSSAAEVVLLGPTGAPEAPPFAASGAADAGAGADGGSAIATVAAAVAIGSELDVLTYAVRRPKGSACADGVLATSGAAAGAVRHELLPHACPRASVLRAAGAARAKHGIALATAPDAVAVEAWLLDGADARPALLETVAANAAAAKDAGATGQATIDVPTVAAGTSSVAAAYVVDRGGARELHVARLGKSGQPAAKVEILDNQNVSGVALAFEDDTLHVVWSSFVPEKKRYVLRWSKWPAGGAATAPQSIGTGVVSARAPALAIDRGRFLLAWAEGDGKATTVKVGASHQGLAPISGLARVISRTDMPADAPAVAMEGDAMFIVWTEREGGQPSARASALGCLE